MIIITNNDNYNNNNNNFKKLEPNNMYNRNVIIVIVSSSCTCSRSTGSKIVFRGGSWTAARTKMELFAIIGNGFQPLTIITKCYILDVAAILDLPLVFSNGKLEGLSS